MSHTLSGFALAALLSVTAAQAQTPFNTKDSINVNKINAMSLVHGDMWWDPQVQIAKCTFPNSTTKNIGFTGTLWMSGYDNTGALHVAAQTYRQDGNDYWPGPLAGTTGALPYATSEKWAKIWKLRRSDIQYFLSLSTHTTSTTPAAILTWPAAGNTYAAGYGGAPLTIAAGTDMAPFVDVNSNGLYEPLLGDYPDVKGDMALWSVFNDNGPSHDNTDGLPLGVEVQTSTYAYNRGTLIDNVVYYNYRIVNRSANTYDSFRFAIFTDIDLGYYLDDYIGYDSAHRMGIAYNANNDDGASAGHPANSYGTSIPMVGITCIKVVPAIDTAGPAPMGAFTYYRNDSSAIGNPTTGLQYDGYMRGRIRSGDYFTNDYAGPGIVTTGTGTGPITDYVFTGDPSLPAQWSECYSTNPPGDRRFVLAAPQIPVFAPGAVYSITFALLATDPDTLSGCPNRGFADIRTLADTAWGVFENPLPVLGMPAAKITDVKVYPNPVSDKIYIETQGSSDDGQLTIFSIEGRQMEFVSNRSNGKVDVSVAHLPAGTYILVYRNGETYIREMVVKY